MPASCQKLREKPGRFSLNPQKEPLWHFLWQSSKTDTQLLWERGSVLFIGEERKAQRSEGLEAKQPAGERLRNPLCCSPVQMIVAFDSSCSCFLKYASFCQVLYSLQEFSTQGLNRTITMKSLVMAGDVAGAASSGGASKEGGGWVPEGGSGGSTHGSFACLDMTFVPASLMF